MKKIILFLFLILGVGMISAQETVLLRNGSVIKGVVTDNVQNNTISVKTSDGNVFVYDMGEVMKITREKSGAMQTVRLKNGSIIKGYITERKPNQYVTVQTRDGNVFRFTVEELESPISDDSNARINDNTTSKISPSSPRSASQTGLYTGYRGFVDVTYHMVFNDYTYFYSYGGMFSTVHGGYVLPYLYVGGGAGLGFKTVGNKGYSYEDLPYWFEEYVWDRGLHISFPLFLNVRGYYPLKSGGGGPFIDTRIGFNVVNFGINSTTSSSFFTCLALGWSWNTNNGSWNFSSGWEFENELSYPVYNHWFFRFGYEF